MKKTVDYIIVGQGLAGSCLALQLIDLKKEIIVFDEPEKNHSSAIAAGLFNPISGKWMTKSWMADEAFLYLFKFYQDAEKKLNANFFHPKQFYRPFISIEEQNDWMARSQDRGLKDFIHAVYVTSTFSHFVHDSFGGVVTKQSGYVEVNSFLKAVMNMLNEKKFYRKEFFDHSKIKAASDSVSYENMEARSVIFCDGFTQINPFFNWLPIRALKGETLSVTLSEKPEMIFNRGIYLSPSSENSFTIGATYKPADSTPGVTSEARTELEDKAKKLIKTPFEIHHQSWGIRPTTPDRRPVLGAHPEYQNILIFNGLGTKGVSLAPYFSELLARWLEGNSKIPPEVNIERFKALYSKLSSD